MLKPPDINYLDEEVIKAYAASARTSRKSYALDSSQLIVHLAINKARRINWK
ncbi:hypothetical protein KP-KP34p18 [Klebsiella phage KP34]|uniref:Uncharacterized protein 18 n=1 Tax=Klebsiella phage KP34 TaxID=674081 RepID=D1L320_BPK34|nr:hypothetical protein KP-KP34p18 [Klebsiella phage KP34]ACY66749.1 hypothetical protein [Klebsiella phage KP34]